MVTTKLWGRTGNQMFMIAAVIGYAKKHGLEYHIPPTTKNHALWPPNFLKLFNKKYRSNRPVVKISEASHAYQELPFKEEWRNLNIELDGYWQSHKYFDHCREDILKAFNFPWTYNYGFCSIHYRLGDYLLPQHLDKHPVITVEYLNKAIRFIGEYGITKFVVFSDDIVHARNIIELKVNNNGCQFQFSQTHQNDPLHDLLAMSLCEHNIISNSTYSWWSAWLNRNPDKIVVSPHEENWFGPGNKNLDTSTLIPDNWVRIKY